MTDYTYLNMSASVGQLQLGAASSIGAAVGAEVTITSTPASAGDNRGRLHMPALGPFDYGTYLWQAFGLASGLAISPFIFYGFWKATSFLSNHLSAFGWAWIACFLVSFFVALYLEDSGSGSLANYVVGGQQTHHVSYAQVVIPAEGVETHHRFNPNQTQSAGASSGAGAGLAPSRGHMATQIPMSTPAKQQVQGSPGHIFESLPSTAGGAQLQTPAGRVFNDDTN